MLIMYLITNIVNFVRTKASSMNDALQFYFQTIIKCPILTLNYDGRRWSTYIMYVHTYCIAQFIIGMRLYKHKVAHHEKRELSYWQVIICLRTPNVTFNSLFVLGNPRSGRGQFSSEQSIINVSATSYKPSLYLRTITAYSTLH